MPRRPTADADHGPARTGRSCLRLAAAALSLLAVTTMPLPASTAEIPAIAAHQRAEKKSFTDAEITDGFFKTAFGAEYHLA